MSSYLVRCKSCGVSNRVPSEREGAAGTCGNCRAKLPALYFRPIPVTDQTFDAFVKGYDGPVLAEFWAPW